jgi:hypothetical protein
MPTHCSADEMDFGRAIGRCVVAAFDGGLVTSDAGALMLASTCTQSAPVRQNAGFHERRISGSS